MQSVCLFFFGGGRGAREVTINWLMGKVMFLGITTACLFNSCNKVMPTKETR